MVAPICPSCRKPRTIIKQTEQRRLGRETLLARRRACLDCEYRWTTFEVPEAHAEALYSLRQLVKDLK